MSSILNMAISRELMGEMQIIASILFFGLSFVLARYAMIDRGIGPITFTACRFVVSTTLLYVSRPCAQKFLHSEVEKEEVNAHTTNDFSFKSDTMQLWLLGTICGAANFCGSTLLQIGLVTVSAGKAGFITGMYVVFIPVVEYFIPGFGVKLTWKSWLAAFICLVGLYFLSGCAEQDVCIGGALKEGEVLVMISTGCWIVSIMVGDIGAKSLDVISFTLVDFFVSTILSIICAVVMEPESWVYPFSAVTRNWLILIVIGITEATAFPLSTMGQMYVAPARASLLMSLESLSCAVMGFLFLKEYLTHVELFGCALMFVAMLVSSSGSDDGDDGEESGDEEAVKDSGCDEMCGGESAPIIQHKLSFGSIEMTSSNVQREQARDSSGHSSSNSNSNGHSGDKQSFAYQPLVDSEA